jgi:hypothetical protein
VEDLYLSRKLYNVNGNRRGLPLAMGGCQDQEPGVGDRRERKLVAIALAIGGLLTVAWIGLLVWFVFFYFL